MSILTQLRKLEKDRTRYKNISDTAREGYQALQPQYSMAVQSAKNYQSTLTEDYNLYVTDRDQAINNYNSNLQQSYETYESVKDQGTMLRNRHEATQKELQRMREFRDSIGVTANKLYTTGSSQEYQAYIGSTYNPSAALVNQYITSSSNPAAQAYSSYLSSGKLQSALTDYETLASDTGYVDRASSDTKSVYDASAKKYKDLQAAYQSLEEPLSQYVTEANTASEQIRQLNSQLPSLQRSLKVEQDPQKRETRIGYGRSLMTSGTKRRSSAR